MAEFLLGAVIALVAGALLLFKGADVFVDGAEDIAVQYDLSPTLIGLTVVPSVPLFPNFW